MGGTSADYGAVQQTGQNRRPRLTAAPAEKGGGRCRRRHLPLPRVPEPAKYEAPGSRRRECAGSVRFRAAIPEMPKRSPVMARAGPFPGARRRSRRPDGRIGDTFFYRAKSSPRLPLLRETHVRKRPRTAVRTKRGCPNVVGQPLFSVEPCERTCTVCCFSHTFVPDVPAARGAGRRTLSRRSDRRCGERRLRTATCRCRSSQEYRR